MSISGIDVGKSDELWRVITQRHCRHQAEFKQISFNVLNRGNDVGLNHAIHARDPNGRKESTDRRRDEADEQRHQHVEQES